MPLIQQETDGGYVPKTIREEIAETIISHQDNIARLVKLEHTIPARYLDMRRDHVWEKFGFHIHF